MQRIVVGEQQIQGNILYLTPAQQHYLLRVLRLREGDLFLALNGRGALWQATLQATGEHAALTAIAPLHQPTPALALVACLPKQGFDEVVRQVTELGVAEIVPILSDRTLLHPSSNKIERWRRIAGEAAEQSERLTIPRLHDPMPWAQWLIASPYSQRLLCVARPAVPSLLSISLGIPSPAAEIAIGPEGGWTHTEIEQAIAAGYQPVSLGNHILRAVTATVAALSILQAAIEFATMNPNQLKSP
jgi:16S rRNA (uracil1498-N3)-methyltransferase